MIRVTKTEEQSHTIVTIDGELAGESIALVETCCNQAKSNGKPVRLFLRDVSTVDQAGQVLLSRLAAKGVVMAARGVYTSYLIQTVTSAGVVSGPPSAERTGRLGSPSRPQ